MLAAASDAIPADAVRTLLERGADPHAKTPSGDTALRFAQLRGNTPVTAVLLKAGARPDDGAVVTLPTVTPAPSADAAVARALPLLQQADRTFLKKSGCVSCHHNSVTAMTVAAARTKGLEVDDLIAKEQLSAIGRYLDTWRDRALQGIGIPGDATTVSYILLGLAAEKYPADVSTDAMARFLKGQQTPAGSWRLLAHRPPIESSEVLVTAISMRALQNYAPAANREPYDEAIRRAAAWIAKAEPHTTEDRAFKVLGLHWSGGSPGAVRAAGRALTAQQRADGGWSQLPSLESDAYATGQALYALAESRALSTKDAAYRRGIQFLLKTQLADGSWFVRSRALPIQPHFESGFPHGKHQFVSAAGSNWAALALTVGSQPGVRRGSE